MPRFRDYTRATSLEPTDALEIDRVSFGTMYIEAVDLLIGAPYIFSWNNLGLPFSNGEIIGGHVFVMAVSLPANMTGSAVKVDPSSYPEAQTVIPIVKLSGLTSTSLGTLTVNTDGSYVISTSAATFAIGDLIKATSPSPSDSTLANLWFTGYATITG